MWSLHLPGDIYNDLNDQTALPYVWVPGDDKPGDFREPGVAFQPIEAVVNLGAVTEPNQVAWYWDQFQ